MNMTDRWFTDRRIVLGSITLAAAFLVNAAVSIWVTSAWFQRMDSRGSAIEISLADRPGLISRFIKVEADATQFRAEVTARLDRIEDKVDRLIENTSERRLQP